MNSCYIVLVPVIPLTTNVIFSYDVMHLETLFFLVVNYKKKHPFATFTAFLFVKSTHLDSIPRLSTNLMSSETHTAVVEKYMSDETVLVYRSVTVYVAATSVITVRQYTLKTTLTFSVEGREWTLEGDIWF